jgi:hypothetical protein
VPSSHQPSTKVLKESRDPPIHVEVPLKVSFLNFGVSDWSNWPLARFVPNFLWVLCWAPSCIELRVSLKLFAAQLWRWPAKPPVVLVVIPGDSVASPTRKLHEDATWNSVSPSKF